MDARAWTWQQVGGDEPPAWMAAARAVVQDELTVRDADVRRRLARGGEFADDKEIELAALVAAHRAADTIVPITSAGDYVARVLAKVIEAHERFRREEHDLEGSGSRVFHVLRGRLERWVSTLARLEAPPAQE